MKNTKKCRFILVVLVMSIVGACRADKPDTTENFSRQREAMVTDQIKARGIDDDRVLDAMRAVKRHLFVPPEYRPFAYSDQPLPIGEDQTISQPYIVGLMTDLLDLDGDEKILEVGTGSGYQAAVLALLADSVFSIEIVEPLAERSKALLDSLGYRNVVVKAGDGYIGWKEHAPFDAVIVTCAPPKIPRPLTDQLAEGGRMVIPVGERWQELLLIEKHDDTLSERRVLPVRFVPMTGDSIR